MDRTGYSRISVKDEPDAFAHYVADDLRGAAGVWNHQ